MLVQCALLNSPYLLKFQHTTSAKKLQQTETGTTPEG